ncbi:hypothetical protein RhiirA1_439906 [Rhizophagus irregularis]|uniref:Uncharacterized protein n=1 Tax=Rhizophagus irregularis TaxID=588596 RepID=A0A2N0S226_9GLOM|nr:hypothetical protein RhiirA1_439906 [Rhizophagus irregularis]
MATRSDFEICGSIQDAQHIHTLRRERESNHLGRVWSNINPYLLGRLMSPLDLYLSTSGGDELRCEKKLFGEKSGTLSKEYDDNTTTSQNSTSNRELDVLYCEPKGKIHDGFLSSLYNTDELKSSRIESTNNADITMGVRLPNCPNSRKLKDVETRFGQLLRVGSMAGDYWTDEIVSRPCRLVHAHSHPVHKPSRTIDCQEAVCNLQSCVNPNCFLSAGNDSPSNNNSLIVVDTFEKSVRFQIATFIKGVSVTEPKEVEYYIADVADFGFDHIIYIGETEYGMLFLDCYDRVFLWDNMSQMAYPLGDSLEEVPERPIEDKAWYVENGIVYEHIG